MLLIEVTICYRRCTENINFVSRLLANAIPTLLCYHPSWLSLFFGVNEQSIIFFTLFEAEFVCGK